MKKGIVNIVLICFLLIIQSSSVFAATSKRVYTHYNLRNGDSISTIDLTENDVLNRDPNWLSGDRTPGSEWFVSSDEGAPVYRIFNPSSGLHLFTMDRNEVEVLCSKHGWIKDNNGRPVFYSYGSVPVYRILDPSNGGHLFSAGNETFRIYQSRWGWINEGVKLFCLKVLD